MGKYLKAYRTLQFYVASKNYISAIPESDFNVNKGSQVEIIGRTYQYCNTELKAKAFAKKGKITRRFRQLRRCLHRTGLSVICWKTAWAGCGWSITWQMEIAGASRKSRRISVGNISCRRRSRRRRYRRSWYRSGRIVRA